METHEREYCESRDEGRDGMMVERFSMTYMKLEVDATASGTTITADFDWL